MQSDSDLAVAVALYILTHSNNNNVSGKYTCTTTSMNKAGQKKTEQKHMSYVEARRSRYM